ncbi:glutathione S-transferase family protein [Tropicimonas sp. S265A]|uniref:glutathione S-transferase family protein n=1 Tax=Tropicimonas sp. S265A TaxID=3415134 RepID=UPI003C7AB33C
MGNYTVIGTAKSRAFRVLWMLEELQAPYTHVAVSPRDQVVRGHNPSGKVPVLLAGDAVLTDSAAILTYLADSHAQLTEPAGTLARAHQDAITHLVLDELDALLWAAARHSFVLPEDRRVPEVKDSLRWEFTRNCRRLATRMGDAPFAAGDQMRITDIILTHCLGWAINAKFEIEAPSLLDYLGRMRERPAFIRASAR